MAGNTVDLGIQGCTNFEKASHQTLYDMVADADHLHIIVMGSDLVDAGKEIARITHDLEAYARQTQAHWKGEGAQAFDDWTRETARESRKLGHYAKNTGEAMVDAATALGQAKLMPKPPELRNFVETDPGKANGVTALTKDPDREAAIGEMSRLASYYRTAQEKIAQQEAPNFRPASGFVPEPKDAGQTLDPVTDGRPEAVAGFGSATPTAGNGSGGHHAGASQPTADAAQHERHVGTSVDSATPITSHQAAPHREGSTPAQPPTGTVSPLPGPVLSGPPSRPGTVAVPDRPGRAARGSEPTADRRAATPGPSGRATEEGINGGTARRGRTTVGRPHLPTGTVVGEEHGGTAPRPVGPGRTGKAMAQEGAVHSGRRLVPPYGEPVDRPRGPVMGEERGSLPRGLAGGSHSGNTGGSTGQRVPNVPGRRMAYEPGGIVGTGPGGVVAGEEHRSGGYGSTNGRNSSGGVAQEPTAGRSSTSEPGRASGRAPSTSTGRASDFTAGGAGLARGTAQSSGLLPASGSPSSRRRKSAASQRPDYLQEDGGSWTAQHPSVVPPVIE